MTSGIPEDAVTNTFFVNTPTPTEDGQFEITLAWSTFMSAFTGSLSGRVAGTGHTLTGYNMADPEPRVPVWTSDWSLTGTPSGDSMPTEVALCVSFKADLESGTPAARRRGRIYLGPFDTSPNSDGRPSAAFVEGVADAASTFAQDLIVPGFALVVYSRVDGVARTATGLWVDNAWDTQRRRGLIPTARETRAILFG